MKLPKFFRTKRGGKEIGAIHVRVKGKRVNLNTQNYKIAGKRRIEAMRGKTKFQSDSEGAAEDTVAALDAAPDMNLNPGSQGLPVDGGGDSPAPPSTETGAPADDAPPPDAGDWAGDANAAAGSPTAPDEPPPPPLQLSPEFVESILSQLAAVFVDVQIRIQDYCERYALKAQPGVIPPDHSGRISSQKLWHGQLKKWVRVDVPLPEWAQAIINVGITTIPTQIANRTPLPKDGEQPPIADADIVSDAA